jgi:hypothetical protein
MSLLVCRRLTLPKQKRRARDTADRFHELENLWAIPRGTAGA